MKLVIVESPTKAKTISRFLGKEYRIESSFGHIRDLPKSKLGVDVEKDFAPKYVIPTKSRKRVNELKKLAQKADEIYLATDEDREGEAIAWHLIEIIDGKDVSFKRIAFHEITKEAIEHALENPRDISVQMVDAQQARRILDRLVGYELSPFLWKKVYRGLSAGRVQSVAVRLIVEREREIQAFKPQEYWTIDALFSKKDAEFPAALHSIDGKKVEKLQIENEEQAQAIVKELEGAAYTISDITQKKRQRKPNAPFRTSTLQQEANTRLGFSAKQTMMLAQQLYEGVAINGESTGLITYMRTDSVNLAEKFQSEANSFINDTYGKEYADKKVFAKKAKGAQEAHEAIRPTDVTITPESIKEQLDARQFKLYDLIWRRAVASQMSSAEMLATSVNITADKYTFRATGMQIKFDGWLKIYPAKAKEQILPELQKDDEVTQKELQANQHFTEPPARYTEASLVKALEERGIGRPSTYAPTISTIQARKYIRKEQKKLIPEEVGFVVNDLLVEHFPEIVDYDFTAKMETSLDDIAEGKKEWQPLIKEFYHPFKEHLMKKDEEISKKDITETETDEKCDKCGEAMVIKMGRYGKFLACTAYPDCKNTKPLDGNGEPEEPETTDKKCKECGKPMIKRNGRFGPFLGCSGYPECKTIVNIESKVGVTCPKCGKGDIIERRSRRGKLFYSCNKYPDCENAYWSKPTGEECPECKALLVFGANNTARCSSKECKFSKDLEE